MVSGGLAEMWGLDERREVRGASNTALHGQPIEGASVSRPEANGDPIGRRLPPGLPGCGDRRAIRLQ